MARPMSSSEQLQTSKHKNRLPIRGFLRVIGAATAIASASGIGDSVARFFGNTRAEYQRATEGERGEYEVFLSNVAELNMVAQESSPKAFYATISDFLERLSTNEIPFPQQMALVQTQLQFETGMMITLRFFPDKMLLSASGVPLEPGTDDTSAMQRFTLAVFNVIQNESTQEDDQGFMVLSADQAQQIVSELLQGEIRSRITNLNLFLISKVLSLDSDTSTYSRLVQVEENLQSAPTSLRKQVQSPEDFPVYSPLGNSVPIGPGWYFSQTYSTDQSTVNQLSEIGLGLVHLDRNGQKYWKQMIGIADAYDPSHGSSRVDANSGNFNLRGYPQLDPLVPLFQDSELLKETYDDLRARIGNAQVLEDEQLTKFISYRE